MSGITPVPIPKNLDTRTRQITLPGEVLLNVGSASVSGSKSLPFTSQMTQFVDHAIRERQGGDRTYQLVTGPKMLSYSTEKDAVEGAQRLTSTSRSKEHPGATAVMANESGGYWVSPVKFVAHDDAKNEQVYKPFSLEADWKLNDVRLGESIIGLVGAKGWIPNANVTSLMHMPQSNDPYMGSGIQEFD